MTKRLVSIFSSLIFLCVLSILPFSGYAAATSSAFPISGNERLDGFCQQFYGYVCGQVLGQWKTDDVRKVFGNAYLKAGYCYYKSDEGLFYMKFVYDFADSPSTVTGVTPYYGYAEIKDNKVNQLSAPKYPIKDNDWILINKYSELDCYKTAENYFNNQRWNNPSSIKIYGYTVSYGAGTYVYYIDYSGENGFGGTTRDTFVIEVDAATNEVLWGASSN